MSRINIISLVLLGFMSRWFASFNHKYSGFIYSTFGAFSGVVGIVRY